MNSTCEAETRSARALAPYPVYKDSGVDWLGMVPEHWDLRRTNTLLLKRNEKGHPNEPLLAATQTKGVVRKEHYENRTVLAMKDLHLLKLVHVKDFVISLRSFQGGIENARQRGIISPAYTVLYPVCPEHHGYLAHLLKSAPYIQNLSLFVTGIRQGQNIDYEKLSRSHLPIPPLGEQAAIVRFLDHADRRIRRYIRAKERLIELLEEQKQAIIHQAVTGQIDVQTGQPYPAYKSSGVEWLGKVPEQWSVLPLKRAFASMEYGISESGTDDGTIAVLTMGHILNGTVRIPDYGGVKSVVPNLLLKDKDLLFNRTNSAELVAKVGMFRLGKRPATFASYLVRMRINQDNNPEFLNLLLNDAAFLATARREAIPSLHQSNLNPTRYGRLQIVLPPVSEQQGIAEFVAACASDIDRAVARASREIDLLNEYRTRLIADVVTGKLDVREATAAIPEKLDAPTDAMETTDLENAVEMQEQVVL